MAVIVMKTINGDEIVADQCDTNGESAFIEVDRPRLITVERTKDGKGSLALYPYLLSNPEGRNIPINLNCVVTIFAAPQDLAKAYTSSVSGIVLA